MSGNEYRSRSRRRRRYFKRRHTDRSPKNYSSKSVDIMALYKLLDKDRFMISTSYNKKIVAFFRTIPEREWDDTKKIWSFPNEYCRMIITQLQALGVLVYGIPEYLRNSVQSIPVFHPESTPSAGISEIRLSDLEKQNCLLAEKANNMEESSVEPTCASSCGKICLKCEVLKGGNVNVHTCEKFNVLNLEEDKNDSNKEDEEVKEEAMKLESLNLEKQNSADDLQKSFYDENTSEDELLADLDVKLDY